MTGLPNYVGDPHQGEKRNRYNGLPNPSRHGHRLELSVFLKVQVEATLMEGGFKALQKGIRGQAGAGTVIQTSRLQAQEASVQGPGQDNWAQGIAI